MPVNLERLNTKLGALQAKDAAAIVAAQINIPFLNLPYTLAQFQAWLNKRINQLQDAAVKSEAQILTIRTNLYNGLKNAEAEACADKIIARQSFEFPANLSSANYDRLVGIILLTFVLN